MTDKPRSGYGKLAPGLWRWLLRNPVVAVISHWTFQSLLYMDATERWFKIGLDVALTIVVGTLLSFRVSWPMAGLVAFLLAHTLNFLFNGHLWGVLKHFGLVRHTREQYASYFNGLSTRFQRDPSIKYATVHGSLARQEWSPTSDLDVRLLRKPGIYNGLRACCYAMCERSQALLSVFPLDIYVLDSEESYRKLRQDERGSNPTHYSS